MFADTLFVKFLSLYRGFWFFLSIIFLAIFRIFITELNPRWIISRILWSLFWFTGIAPLTTLIYFYQLKIEKDKQRDLQKQIQ